MNKPVKIPLSDFQQWMQQLLLDPYQQTKVNPSSLLSSESNADSIEDVICHTQKMNANEHLAIYQRSYIARLRNCMAQQFSALEYALGEAIFCAFADDYLASNPSHNYNLAHLGANFSAYLKLNRPDANEEIKEDWIDFMIELAQFEFALGLILEQKAEENYPLATIETHEENIKLVPIVELFKFQFPVRKYYSDFKQGHEPNLPIEYESYCVVLRHQFKLAVYDLHPSQYEFLKLLKEGDDIANAKARFERTHNLDAFEFENKWRIWKNRWIEANFFRV